MSSGSSLETGPIIGIVVGSVVGLAMCTYMCCFRKYVMRKQTQKLMDATNLMHAQEPQGTISPGVLPDGSIGLLVRPLPTNASLSVAPPATLMPPNVYPPQHPPQHSLQNSASHSTTVSTTPLVPGLSTHPQPGVAVTLNGESLDRIVPQEIKGAEQSSGRWEPRPFVPPTRSSFVSSGNPGTISEFGPSGPLWQTNPVPDSSTGSTGSRYLYPQSELVASGG
ncbi:hypothetical protein BGX20_002916, partial [Mortierella sp. AD010]